MPTFTTIEVFEAYEECRKNKVNKPTTVEFDQMQGDAIPLLTRELNDGTYKIGASTVFVIAYPSFREAWAANFRDRIVHHLLIRRIEHDFQKKFIFDSYACIKGKGSLFGAERVHGHLRSATENWTKEAHFLQADIANYFVSIDKAVLSDLILPYIENKRVSELVSQVIWHDPTANYVSNSPPHLFKKVPHHKSLFNCPVGKGLPIGNLSSQFFANVYLNELDQLVKRVLKVRWYGRYVDDVVIVGHCPKQLNQAFKAMQTLVEEKLKLKFHPNKTNRNLAEKGMDFCGYLLMPHRKYVRKRTVTAMRKAAFSEDRTNDPERWAARVNSYLGICSHADSWNTRKRLAIDTGAAFGGKLNKVVINRKRIQP